MRATTKIAMLICGALLAPFAAQAAETDQYMTWEVELKDSSAAFNAYLNEEAAKFVEIRNKRTRPTETNAEMALGFYAYLFEGLHRSRMRNYLASAEEIDRFPRADVSPWEYQRSSIYREFSFPYILPMSRTIRLGEVYLGIDKMCHFFGFGRRYCSQYLRLRAQGREEADAIESVIKRGLFQESALVGGLVDGIISYGDLEANFQGMMMVKDLCGDKPPCFVRNADGEWRFEGAIDIVPYVTPGMDESWNNSLYTGLRRRNVVRRLEAEYCDELNDPVIKQRFARYGEFPPSRSQEVIREQHAKDGVDPREKQMLSTICKD